MRHLRALVRILALGILTACIYFSWVVTGILAPLSRGFARRSRSTLARTWAQSSAAILGMGLVVRGEPPEPPYLLVCNHLSYVDVLVLWCRLDCVFLAKADVARWPVVGLLARSAGTLFVDRDRHSELPRVIEELRQVLAAGRGAAVFPEATSSDGARVLPFKSSLFEVALRAGVPVSYASLSYRTPPSEPSARSAVCWWGDMSFLPHLYTLLGLSSFQASLVFGSKSLRAGNRKALALEAHHAVTEQFTPVPG